jgi:ABC-2 type transport system permease protein
MGLALPMLLLFMFGYALTLDVDNVPLAIWDQSGTTVSREFVSRFTGSRYFSLTRTTTSYPEIERAIDRREAVLALVIPVDFSRRVGAGTTATVQAIVDGSDSNTATIALGYAEFITRTYTHELTVAGLQRAGGATLQLPVDLRPRVWFNADLASRNAIVPGLIAIIMMVIAALLTSLTVAREWETGTMEQLIATPITGTELLLGKLAPYVCIGLFDVTLAVLVGRFVFQVPFRGDRPLLVVLALLFLLVALCFGVLISVVGKSQFVASQFAMVATMLPAFLLSGFVFPIENMPLPMQAITHLIPARYFVTILRGLYLKGVGLEVLWPEALLLTGFGLLVTVVAVKKFKKKIC